MLRATVLSASCKSWFSFVWTFFCWVAFNCSQSAVLRMPKSRLCFPPTSRFNVKGDPDFESESVSILGTPNEEEDDEDDEREDLVRGAGDDEAEDEGEDVEEEEEEKEWG